MSNVNTRTVLSSLIGIVALAALLFIPAGTFDYWQAWTYMAVFAVSSWVVGIYLAVYDPALLESRLKVGPGAETETSQKIIMALALAGWIVLIVMPALDRRFGWSSVPAWISWVGNGLVVAGFVITLVVFRANRYGASTVRVTEGQTVISTGPYAYVRHPMYAGAWLLVLGTPLALGSWWGLAVVALMTPVLIWRLLDEERFLANNLPGYTDYQGKVRYRLLPGVF